MTTGSGGLSALAAAAAEKASGRSSGPPVYAKTASWKKRNLEDLIGPSEQLPTPASEAEPDPRGKRQEMGSSAPASAAAAPPTKPAAPAAAAGAAAHEAAAAAAGKADPAFSFPSLVPSAQHTTVRCYSRLGPQQAEQVPAKPAAAAPVPPADGAAVPRNNVALRALRDALKVQVRRARRRAHLLGGCSRRCRQAGPLTPRDRLPADPTDLPHAPWPPLYSHRCWPSCGTTTCAWPRWSG